MDPNWQEALNRFERTIDCGTEAMRIKAISKLAQLSNHAPEYVLGRTIPVLANLVADHSSNSSNLSLQRVIVYCLKCIACQGDGRLASEIGQSDALLSILRLFPESSDGSFQRVAVKCLWCLVNLDNGNRLIVAMNGGLEIIISMLNSSTSVRRYLLEILSALSLLRMVRRRLACLGGVQYLVEAASCGNMLSRERACQAIGLLGVARRARRMLVELGVIPVLVELLRVGDSATKLVAGNSLGVISAHIDYIGPVAQAGSIPLFAELLQGPEPLGHEIAEDVFCLLAVAEANAVSIAEHLVRILREGNNEAKAAAANVFWDLSGYKHSVFVVRNSGVIPLMVELLGSQSSEVRETVSGAIAQLSYNEVDREALIESGAVSRLLELLHDDSEELKDNAAEALINFYEDPMQQERLSEVADHPSFQSMRDRLIRIRASDDRMVSSMRAMNIEQLAWED